MSRLTRDGTAKPVARDQLLRREMGQENINFPYSADQEQDWLSYPVDSYSARSFGCPRRWCQMFAPTAAMAVACITVVVVAVAVGSSIVVGATKGVVTVKAEAAPMAPPLIT